VSGRWLFYRGGPSAPRYGGDPTKHAVDQDVETFVREVLQNANDQARDDLLAPVEVRFRFLSLSGEELESFREAIGWDQLHDHLQAVAEMDRGLGHRQFLDKLDEEEELRLLVVEDRNTTGLVGEWDDAGSNYTALVRDELYSNKQDDTAGGTYGLGKSVLWTFSGASTVLFDSVLHADDPRTNRRLIARSKLPTHDLNGDEYQVWRREDLNVVSEKTQMDTIRVFIGWCESIDAVQSGLRHKVKSPAIPDGGNARETALFADQARTIFDHLETYEYATVQHVCWLVFVRTGMSWHASSVFSTTRLFDTEKSNPASVS
jgi:hypothetical protein